jgi:hypothetical protein
VTASSPCTALSKTRDALSFNGLSTARQRLRREAVARELPKVSLEDALRLVHLYAEKESPKFEKAAIRWLRRYLKEASPELSDVAKVVAELDQRRDAPYG